MERCSTGSRQVYQVSKSNVSFAVLVIFRESTGTKPYPTESETELQFVFLNS